MREQVMKGTIDFRFLFSTFCNQLFRSRLNRHIRIIVIWKNIRNIYFWINSFYIIFSEAIARSLRSNKEMVAALLTDYKSQDFDDSAETLPVALPLESKFENRYENNEIRR